MEAISFEKAFGRPRIYGSLRHSRYQRVKALKMGRGKKSKTKGKDFGMEETPPQTPPIKETSPKSREMPRLPPDAITLKDLKDYRFE